MELAPLRRKMKTPAIRQGSVPEQITGLDKLGIAGLGAGNGLNVVLVYEEAETRQWAREVYERVSKFAGAGKVRATWWKIGELNQPGVLAGAVSMAMRAKLIVVATRGAEGLPLPFYVWVNGWLPHRFSAAGA